MKKTKLIPPIIMLLAGAITSILAYRNNYESIDMLRSVLVVLVVFYIIGLIVKKILDTFTVVEESLVSDEGEVMEKDIDQENDIQEHEEKE